MTEIKNVLPFPHKCKFCEIRCIWYAIIKNNFLFFYIQVWIIENVTLLIINWLEKNYDFFFFSYKGWRDEIFFLQNNELSIWI